MSFIKRFIFPVFIVTILIVGSLITWYTYRNAKQESIMGLEARTNTIAQLVSEKELDALSHNLDDLTNPLYLQLKDQFKKARKVNPDIRFIYIFTIEDGVVKFIIDSEPKTSEDYSPPGQTYPEADEQPEIAEVFTTGKSIIQPAYTDRWGRWITGLSPITDEEGPIRYIVGIDIDAQDFTIKPIKEASFPAILSFLILMLACTMYIIRKRELALIETKAQFVSVASHELRSPLTGIRWSAENVLENKSVEGDVRTMIKAIHSSTMQLLSTVTELLSVSQAEHDFINKTTFEKIDIQNIVHKALEELDSLAKSKHIKLVFESEEVPLWVKGNPDRLLTLFTNFISNAIKYSPRSGEVIVSAGIHTSFGKKTVRVAVRDQGIGIPHGDIKKVLSGFYRSRNAKAYTVKGTGLGLYICNKIALLHGGSISVDSIEGKGTIVIAILPFYEK